MITSRDAVQGSWSPHGHRLAFWGEQKGGRRDIWTVAADGHSEPIPVTDDGFIDWNPIWSPDGQYLYFLSNRVKPPTYIGRYALSRDNRRLYYTFASNEADIWLLNLEKPGK